MYLKTLIRSTVALVALLAALPAFAAESAPAAAESSFSIWPLIRYRSTPEEGTRLSLLGPLVSYDSKGEGSETAVRPFFYRTANRKEQTSETDYLYPVAFSSTSPENDTFSAVGGIYSSDRYRKNEEGKQEKGTMLFPFYISGKSEKYGPYVSVFPIYGDIYERFWRDEYHYVLFPLYGRAVKNGTNTTNVLYPFFSVTKGEKESGFQVWPLYGQQEKEGVYRKRFFLWPFFMSEDTGLNGDKPMHRRYALPLYASQESPTYRSLYVLWPFCGYSEDKAKGTTERDWAWPFWMTVRGKEHNADYWLPFYSEDRTALAQKNWLMWPLYRRERITSDTFRDDKATLLYFLYLNRRETWPVDGSYRTTRGLWPLFFYRRGIHGESSVTFPAPVETIMDPDGIEHSWAPLWRLYRQEWNAKGDASLSILWDLVSYERRNGKSEGEIFPLVSWKSGPTSEVRILKGLFGYSAKGNESRMTLFYIPLFHWGASGEAGTKQ